MLVLDTYPRVKASIQTDKQKHENYAIENCSIKSMKLKWAMGFVPMRSLDRVQEVIERVGTQTWRTAHAKNNYSRFGDTVLHRNQDPALFFLPLQSLH